MNMKACPRAIVTVASLPVFSGNPKHICLASIIGMTGGNEQEIGEAVDVFECGGADSFSFAAGKGDHQPFGAPRDRASEVQMGGGGAAAWQHEGFQRLQIGIQPVDVLLQ